MKAFEHINAYSIDEAVSKLSEYGKEAKVIAGGTDLLGCLRDRIWPDEPKAIINLKTIPGLTDIQNGNDGLAMGALTTLTDIAESPVIKDGYPALAQAASHTASPLLRNIGTLAGNICQENRCWYYRYPDKLGGRIDCVRKGGKKCLAVPGDNRYHSIFGAVKKCIAVNPSDTAPALVVLQAKVKTSKSIIDIEDFFSGNNGMKSTVLDDNEIVTGIHLPPPEQGSKSAFRKLAFRKSIDFAIVNCAVSITFNGPAIKTARICLNGVHNNPYRATMAEEALAGKVLNATTAKQAGESALAKARPLPMNRYKVQIAKSLVADTLMECLHQQC